MKRYRIVNGRAYNGCIHVNIWWVQKREEGFWGDKWVNIKGFDRYERAEALLDILD